MNREGKKREKSILPVPLAINLPAWEVALFLTKFEIQSK